MSEAVWILSWATLLQAILFVVILSRPRFFELYSNRLLIALLLAFMIEKADAVFLSSGLALAYPQFVMIGNLFGATIAPLIYFQVRSRTAPDFRIGWRSAWAFTPFVALTLYALFSYHLLDRVEQLELLTTGSILNRVNTLIIPLGGDIVSLVFLFATYRVLRAHAVNVRNWFSTIESRTLSGLRTVVVLMGALILLHFVWTLSGSGGVGVAIYLGHFLMINMLAIGALSAPPDLGEAAKAVRPSGSRTATSEQIAILESARSTLAGQALFADPDLTVSRLARRMNIPQRQLSEAINTAGGTNFHVFVNRARIDAAKERLISAPGQSILEIAFECGFNSKSTFNDAFRKLTGKTPSQFRADA